MKFGMSTRIYMLSVDGENIWDEIEMKNEEKLKKKVKKKSMKEQYLELKTAIDKERNLGK